MGHSHPRHEGKGFDIFSGPDISAPNSEDGILHLTPFSGSGTFNSFLLTPAPESKLLMYSADYKSKATNHEEAVKEGRVAELGHFSKDGKSKLLKTLGFIR
jgi:hypothetical protein